MRRITSALAVALLGVSFLWWAAPLSANPSVCEFRPELGRVVCSEVGGTVTPGTPGSETDGPGTPAVRYVYAAVDATIGDCFYWSNVPGGLDSLDAANDAAIITLVTSRPRCPVVVVPPVDPVATAWEIFRAWDLALPDPIVTPASRGITGIPTHIGVATPDTISYSEVLPDGRILTVRARAENLVIDWGDGTTTTHDPLEATGYPNGTTRHTYDRKTCTADYRTNHPSGGLCHPTAEYYPIVASFLWTGEFDVGSGWQLLGSLTRTAPQDDYDVDEARGMRSP